MSVSAVLCPHAPSPLEVMPDSRKLVYTRYFEFLRVNDGDLLDAAGQIRYQVYCVERRFLDPGRYPRQIEIDQYDAASVHFVGRHRFRQVPAGTVRLVLDSDLGFPMQGHCRFDRDYAFIAEPRHPALRCWAEISRLAVSKLFRQRADDTPYGGPPRQGGLRDAIQEQALAVEGGINPVAAGPEIVAGLFKSMYHETRRRGVTHLLVAMERSLHLMLKRMGYSFHAIGPVVDYYGPVIPYIASIRDLERHLYAKRRSVYDYWMDGLEPEFHPAPLSVTPQVDADSPGEVRVGKGGHTPDRGTSSAVTSPADSVAAGAARAWSASGSKVKTR